MRWRCADYPASGNKGINKDNELDVEILKFFAFMFEKRVKGLKTVQVDTGIRNSIDHILWQSLAIHYDRLYMMNSVKTLGQVL